MPRFAPVTTASGSGTGQVGAHELVAARVHEPDRLGVAAHAPLPMNAAPAAAPAGAAASPEADEPGFVATLVEDAPAQTVAGTIPAGIPVSGAKPACC